ncbi:MAG TPA: hypothetical protein VF789_01485 [Thermoanaerobaculia bacterium]
MRKKMLLLTLALGALAASLQAPRAEADGGYPCVQCTTLSSGAQCCITCWCETVGRFQITTCPAIGCAEI